MDFLTLGKEKEELWAIEENGIVTAVEPQIKNPARHAISAV